VEDLVEEIVGESGRDDKQPAPDVVREPDGGLVMRGSMSIDDVEDLLGVHFETRRMKRSPPLPVY